jgi:hypothetical protein
VLANNVGSRIATVRRYLGVYRPTAGDEDEAMSSIPVRTQRAANEKIMSRLNPE